MGTASFAIIVPICGYYVVRLRSGSKSEIPNRLVFKFSERIVPNFFLFPFPFRGIPEDCSKWRAHLLSGFGSEIPSRILESSPGVPSIFFVFTPLPQVVPRGGFGLARAFVIRSGTTGARGVLLTGLRHRSAPRYFL